MVGYAWIECFDFTANPVATLTVLSQKVAVYCVKNQIVSEIHV